MKQIWAGRKVLFKWIAFDMMARAVSNNNYMWHCIIFPLTLLFNRVLLESALSHLSWWHRRVLSRFIVFLNHQTCPSPCTTPSNLLRAPVVSLITSTQIPIWSVKTWLEECRGRSLGRSLAYSVREDLVSWWRGWSLYVLVKPSNHWRYLVNQIRRRTMGSSES